MTLSQNQRGSSHIVALLVVVVVAGIAFAGYRVMNRDSIVASSVPAVSTSKVPATLKSKSDVEKANASLDSTAIDSSVDPGQLDGDINSLL